MKLPDKSAKKSSLPSNALGKEGFFYYKGTDIATASVKVIAIDGTYEARGIGVKTLPKFEKWTIDVLGGEIHPVQREKRQDFESMKRDPHAAKNNIE